MFVKDIWRTVQIFDLKETAQYLKEICAIFPLVLEDHNLAHCRQSWLALHLVKCYGGRVNASHMTLRLKLRCYVGVQKTSKPPVDLRLTSDSQITKTL